MVHGHTQNYAKGQKISAEFLLEIGTCYNSKLHGVFQGKFVIGCNWTDIRKKNTPEN